MSDKNHDVLGVYSYVDLLLGSVKELRSKGFESIQVFTPCPNHEVEDALDTGKEPSKVKYFTLCGAILGALVGASFTVLTSMDWPVVTSAKPIVSIPPYMIIIFECMILIGGLSTFLGLIINSRLRKNISPHLYDERFSNDKFGVLVNCSSENLEEVESILINHGSEEIKIDGLITEDQEQEPEETPKEEPTKVEVKEEPKAEAKEEPKKEDAPPQQEAKTEAPVKVEEPKAEAKEEPKKEEAPTQQEAKTEAPRDDDDWAHKPATKQGGEKQAPPKEEVKEEPKVEASPKEEPPKVEVKEEPKAEAPPKEEPKAEAPPKEERAQSPEDDKKTKMARLMKMAQKSKGEKEAKEEPKAEAPPKEEVKEEPKAEAPPKVETTSRQEGTRPDLDDWEHKPAKGDKDK